MTQHEEISFLIEQYLDGDLSAAEKLRVENLIDTDQNFKKEFELHLQLRRTLTWSFDKENLQKKMNTYHLEFEPNKSGARKVKSSKMLSFRKVVFAAASVSLLITAGSLTVYYLITQENKKITQFKNLNRTESAAATAQKDVVENTVDPTAEVEQQKIATAFMISQDGFMLTNYHVVAGKKFVYVEKYQDSLQKFVAKVVRVDKNLDIALLQINDPEFNLGTAIPFTFSNQDALIGQKVFTLGYPKNDIVYSEGPISSLTGFKSDTMALQLSLPVNPGNSGAPVFTENGELIGIITGKNIDADGETFSVRSELVNEFLNRVSDTGFVLPKKNLLKNKKVTDQVKLLQPFIYLIKA